jgi:alpha-L-arabinofuranosidase
MEHLSLARRDLLGAAAGSFSTSPVGRADTRADIEIDPSPRFPLSPLLHMQFLEPLGVTDPGLEAAWDYDRQDWRLDFIETSRDLAPGAIRFGGLFSRYYKWREGVGPWDRRPLMRNHVWGGRETNRIGTAELTDLCLRIGAAPIFCVNFRGDGHRPLAALPEGDRTGDAAEAAEWVAYCNDPDHPLRRLHGHPTPHAVRYWQLGNETSYGTGGFTRAAAIAETRAFARAMRGRDPSLKLIGWGDVGEGGELWAGDLVRRAGEQIDLIAIHMMQQLPTRPHSLLRGRRYERDPAAAWAELQAMALQPDARLTQLEQVLDDAGWAGGIAVTEGHLSLAPHNTNPILLEWLTGAYHARVLNTYQRHGRRVQIATAADFNGTRWTVVAVRLQVPRGFSYLTPAGSVMRLFGRTRGRHAVQVVRAPGELDVAASRTANRVCLHMANTSYDRSLAARVTVRGHRIAGGQLHEIAPADLRASVSELEPEIFRPVLHALPPGDDLEWRFPAGSVSAVELDLA